MQAHCWQIDEYLSPLQSLQWREQSLPDPQAGEALVRIKAIGMNRSEFNYVSGRHLPSHQFPSCIGQEAVGEVIALGPQSDRAVPELPPLKVGDRVALLPGQVDVVAMGSYRDLGLYPQSILAPVPAQYSDAQGAGLWMGVFTMAGALLQAGITPENARGKSICITAATSSMGCVGLKLLRAWGAHTIATTRNDSKQAALRELADEVLVCGDSESFIDAMAATQAHGYDAALDPIGDAMLPGLLQCANNGASIISYEMISGGQPRIPLAPLMIKDLKLRGFAIFHIYRDAELLSELLRIGMDCADQIVPVIDRILPLEEAPKALDLLDQSMHLGKIVLQVE